MTQPILVVDSDPHFARALTDLLKNKGHRVSTASSGNEGLTLFQQGRFDLVLTALSMPGIDGLSMISRMRETQPQQEIILLMERTDQRPSTTAVRAGVSGYLLKPVDDSDVTLLVEKTLERAALREERQKLLDEANRQTELDVLMKQGLDLVGQTDIEAVQDKILHELTSVANAQSAAMWLSDDRGILRLKAYRGLVERQHLPERLELEEGLASRLGLGAPWLAGQGSSRVLSVPLLSKSDLVGIVQLSDPLGGDFVGDGVRRVKSLSEFGARAVENAKRFQALQRVGLRDRETAAYNLSYFTDYAGKEIYKARRYGRAFSFLTFSLDNLAQVRLRMGAAEALKATRAVIYALSKIVRDSDIIAKASEHEFYLLLPETDFLGAVLFMRRALEAVREEPDVIEVEATLPLSLVGGAASFPKDGEDFDELIVRCRQRMEQSRYSLQRRMFLENLEFWEEIELLLGQSTSPRLPTDERSEPSSRGNVSPTLFEALQSEVARELLRDPYARGLVYLGVPEIRAGTPLALALESVPSDFAARVYLVGRRSDLSSHPAVTPVFIEGDEQLTRHEFLFWLSENSAYGLVQRRGRGAAWGFHTSDTYVVDGLIQKLQKLYELQPY